MQKGGDEIHNKTKAVIVSLNGETVGRLALTPEKLCAFEYDPEYIRNGQGISPFYLPLKSGVFVARRDPFSGNFGVFTDSLPDGWGNILLDRFLNSHKIKLSNLSVLDRLSIAGSSGMGALEYKPENSFNFSESYPNLDYLASEAEKVLNRNDDATSLDILFKFGGSSGGACPKVLLNIEGEDWLIKFRSTLDPPNVGHTEYEYALLAKECGIGMPETRLFEGKYFGVKRFDRAGSTKLHMLSAAGLLNADYRIPSLDYLSLLTACFKLTGNIEEVYKLYRLMEFNVLIKNRNDHARNFSFLLKDGNWKLSPAYDLLPSNGFNGFHTTTIAGQGDPKYTDIQMVAKSLGLNKNRTTEIHEMILEKCHNFSISQ